MGSGAEVDQVLRWMERRGSRAEREKLARYGLSDEKAYGIAVGDLKREAKRLGRNHALAEALWESGRYEARLMTAFVGEPERLSKSQMDRWCREFDNWAVVDTLCFSFFDASPHALSRVDVWHRRRGEFQRRAGFALLACLALHASDLDDEVFLERLALVDSAAEDERKYVQKGVSWALRAMGERSLALHEAARELARALAASEQRGRRWLGKDALRALDSAAVRKRLSRKAR